jgi:hypothetical protein
MAKGGAMIEWIRPRRVVFAAFISLFLMTGCQSVMSSSSDKPAGRHTTKNMFPLRFKIHAFAVHCYNTVRCQVIYNNFDFGPYGADNQLSPPPPSPDYRDHWALASYIGIRNFPPPAEVKWTSLDGIAHETKVDIGAIFKDERVLYDVPESEIPDGMFPQGLIIDPGIILEVSDRTVNVYMKALIPTKTEQIPGNKYSDIRGDVLLAWSRTY